MFKVTLPNFPLNLFFSLLLPLCSTVISRHHFHSCSHSSFHFILLPLPLFFFFFPLYILEIHLPIDIIQLTLPPFTPFSHFMIQLTFPPFTPFPHFIVYLCIDEIPSELPSHWHNSVDTPTFHSFFSFTVFSRSSSPSALFFWLPPPLYSLGIFSTPKSQTSFPLLFSLLLPPLFSTYLTILKQYFVDTLLDISTPFPPLTSPPTEFFTCLPNNFILLTLSPHSTSTPLPSFFDTPTFYSFFSFLIL